MDLGSFETIETGSRRCQGVPHPNRPYILG